MPVFSVIIALYNKEEYIKDTLNSILNQSFSDFEVIVVDDGSTDRGAALVKGFTDKRITYHKIKNSGVSVTRNTAIELSKGKLLAFIDADDHWEPQHLQVLYELHIQNPEAGLLASRYAIKISERKTLYPSFKGIDDNYSGIVDNYFRSSLTYRIAWTSAVAVPREVLKITGLFNTELTRTEDTELWLRIALQFPVAISNKCTARYNFDLPESLSKTKFRQNTTLNYSNFALQEANNPNLKAFLDIYRIEHALKLRIEGDLLKASELYNAVAPENIKIKTKILFSMPPSILRNLLQLKHWLVKKGIVFSIYN